MRETNRATAREIAQKHIEAGDPLGWFEVLYSKAGQDTPMIPWADLTVNPNLITWLDQNQPFTPCRALKVGCGLGDDAEELARRHFETTAFDISESAIAFCRNRYPQSPVSYAVTDLFHAPSQWKGRFDFVLESYTLQVLPPGIREEAMQQIASFVSPGGTLLVIARGRDPNESEGKMPWPLTKDEIMLFQTLGLKALSFEDYMDNEDPPVRRFRVTYKREK